MVWESEGVGDAGILDWSGQGRPHRDVTSERWGKNWSMNWMKWGSSDMWIFQTEVNIV